MLATKHISRPEYPYIKAQNNPLAVCVALAVLVAAVFWPVLGHDFVALDDDQGIYGKPQVSAGLSWAGLVWALSSVEDANWMPLTRLSHMLDCSLYGLDSGGHHLTNLLLHVAAAIILFLALHRMTGSVWRSALVAALFAVHPLRVESVAWVSERKDVLSGVFWMPAMLAYARFAERPDLRRYLWVAAFLILGLMSKPSVVTLPPALLLLDFWPLERWRKVSVLRLAGEKIPLLVLSAASSAITVYAQAKGGAIGDVGPTTLAERTANAILAVAHYLMDTVWPTHLAPFYPFERSIPGWLVVAAALLSGAATAAAVWKRKTSPYLFTGWMWFLGVLVPMIGLIHVGTQGRADRYTYLPHIGLFVMVVWGAHELLGLARSRRLAVCLSVSSLVLLAVRAHQQSTHWKDSLTLFEHTERISGPSRLITTNYGSTLLDLKRYPEAREKFEQLLTADPEYAAGHANLGTALMLESRYLEALKSFDRAIELGLTNPSARLNRATILLRLERAEEAAAEYGRVLAGGSQAEFRAQAYAGRGKAHLMSGRAAEAERDSLQAIEIDPKLLEARKGLADSLVLQNRLREALIQYDWYLAMNPNDPYARKSAEDVRRHLALLEENEKRNRR